MGRGGEWARGCVRRFAVSPTRPLALSPSRLLSLSPTRSQYIKHITEHTRYKRLAIGSSRFTFNNSPWEIRNTEKFSEGPITTTHLRYLKRPLRVISHFKAVGRIEQER